MTAKNINRMTWFSSLGRSVAGDSTGIAKAIPSGALPTPIKVRPGEAIPTPTPPTRPIDVTPRDPVPSTKPASAGGAGIAGAVGIGGIGLSMFLPQILNSSAITGAISGAAQVGSVAVIAGDIKDVANNLIGSITSSPVNMGIAGVAAAAALYLIFK